VNEKAVPQMKPSVAFADEKDGTGDEDGDKKSEEVDEALRSQDGLPDAVSERLCSPGEDGVVCLGKGGDEGWLGREEGRGGEQAMSGQKKETATTGEGDEPQTTPQRKSKQPTAEHEK